MTKMKRSEFKSLVKECVRECLREIMQEQIMPASLPMREMVSTGPAVGQIINPMDDYQMRLRQELLSQQQQRGMMQQQLQRQSAQNAMASPLQQPVGALSELAGLGAPDDQGPARFNTTAGSGYMSPADRLRFAAPAHQLRSDPMLDAPVRGARSPQQQRAPRFDPSLDTPVMGGDMGSPDPMVMKNVFEDTARTTFLQQAAAGHVRPGASSGGGGGEGYAPPVDKFAEIVSQHDPENLFPGSQNWASLAFKS